MKKLLALVLSLTMALSLAGCGGGSSDKETASNASSDGTYTWHSTTSTITTWNPTEWQIDSEEEIISLTSSELYAFDMDLESEGGYTIKPELAAEMPEDVTAEFAGNETYGVPSDATEGYAWRVKIREDATWEDGSAITTEDFTYSLQQYLNAEMNNYRASSFYSGALALANAEGYYNSGATIYKNAAEAGLSLDDLSAGDDGVYVTKDGAKAAIAWTAANDYWLDSATLESNSDYMDEDTYNGLNDLADGQGYIPVTEDSLKLLDTFITSDDWGEKEADAINYIYYADGVGDTVPWENVGFVADDDYTFTMILVNPCSAFNFEYNVDSLTLVNEELYEANKSDASGVLKSSYGTAVDKYCSYGPYSLTTYQESKQVEFARNDSWYGYSDGEHENQYQTTNIDLQIIDEHTTALSMFLQGNLDEVGLTNDDMDTYGTSDYVYYTPTSYTYCFALNTDYDALKSRESDGINKTILTYKDFREALSLCIDRTDYAKSCTAAHEPAYGLINDIYIAEPETGVIYRDTDQAKQALCDVYGVSDVSELTGYDKEAASKLLQSAYDAALKAGDIKKGDTVEIEYHVYSSESRYQKMVDYVNDALNAAAEGTDLEGRISVKLLVDQDYYNTMLTGQDDMILEAWGGADLDPYSIMECYCSPDYITEYGFDYTQNLTLSVEGKEMTKSFYEWQQALCTGEYATAELDVRNEILAGIEEGLLLNYHLIPLTSMTEATLYSQRVVWGSSEFVNSIVGRGGYQYLTYTMNDQEWEDYCKENNNQLTY